MAQTVSGASPVTFISEDTGATQNAGTQYQIPLALITYDTSKTPPVVLATPWPTYLATSDLALAQAYIQNLINDGVLTLST
jgi:hypothetical protein